MHLRTRAQSELPGPKGRRQGQLGSELKMRMHPAREHSEASSNRLQTALLAGSALIRSTWGCQGELHVTGRDLGKLRANGRSGGGACGAPRPIPEVWPRRGGPGRGGPGRGTGCGKRGGPAPSPGPAAAASAAAAAGTGGRSKGVRCGPEGEDLGPGRRGGGMQLGMLGSRRGEEPRCLETRRRASAGPPGLGPFAAGPNRDARAAPLRVLGALRASAAGRVPVSQSSPDLRPG